MLDGKDYRKIAMKQALSDVRMWNGDALPSIPEMFQKYSRNL